jgi:hypothetical protein
VTCADAGRVAVTPIVTDTFTLRIEGDPSADEWSIVVVQPGEPEIVWTAVAPEVDVDGDALAGSAQMERVGDPTDTADLVFVVDC